MRIDHHNHQLESQLYPIALYSHTFASGSQVHLFATCCRWDSDLRYLHFGQPHAAAAHSRVVILVGPWQVLCREIFFHTSASSRLNLKGPRKYFAFPCSLPSSYRQSTSVQQQTAPDSCSSAWTDCFGRMERHWPRCCHWSPCYHWGPNDLQQPRRSSSGCLFSFSKFK